MMPFAATVTALAIITVFTRLRLLRVERRLDILSREMTVRLNIDRVHAATELQALDGRVYAVEKATVLKP